MESHDAEYRERGEIVPFGTNDADMPCGENSCQCYCAGGHPCGCDCSRCPYCRQLTEQCDCDA